MARSLGSIYVELRLDDKEYRSGISRIKSETERTISSIEKTQKSSDEATLAFKKRMNQQRLVEEEKFHKANRSYIEKSMESTKNILAAAPGFAIATAAISGVYVALRGLRDEFTAGLSAIEDYQSKVASMSSFLTTFNKNVTATNIGDVYNSAKQEAQKMVSILEVLDARTIASGKDLTTMAEGFIKGGVKINLTNKATADGFVNIANAVKLLTKGQNQEIQMRQEIRALTNGEVRTSNVLMATLKAIDPEIKKHLETWKAQGIEIDKVGELLKGFGPAAKDLESTWGVVGSTLSTIHDKVLRGAFLPTYEKLIKFAIELKDSLMTSDGQLTSLAVNIQNAIKSTLNSFDNLIKIIGVGGALYLGVAALNHMLYGTSVAADVAAAKITKLGIAGKLAFSLFAGYEIGKWLSDNFETAKLAGILFVDVIMKGWQYIKFGVLSATTAMGVAWENSINFIKTLFVDFLTGISGVLAKIPTMGGIASDVGKYAEQIKSGITPTRSFSQAQEDLNKQLKSNLSTHSGIIDSLINDSLVKKEATKAAKDYDWQLKSGNEEDKKAIKIREQAIDKLQNFADSLRVKTVAIEQSKAAEVAAMLQTDEWKKAIERAGGAGKKIVEDIKNLAAAFDNAKELDKATKNIDKYYESLQTKLESLQGAPSETEQLLKWEREFTEAMFAAGSSASITTEELDKLYKKMSEFDTMMGKVKSITGEKVVGDLQKGMAKWKVTNLPGSKEENKEDRALIDLGQWKKSWDKMTDIQKEASGISAEMWAEYHETISTMNDNWVMGAQAGLDTYAKSTTNAFKTAGAAVEKAFKGMEDALVEFVKTGKLDFSSMVDSMITDLIRFQIQQSTSKLAEGSSSLLGTIGGAVANWWGGSGFNAETSFSGAQADVSYAAHGNAFNGISGFSNQIVSSPTMFAHSGISKFADGAGLMGEAGPEAIMPLKRTSNGKLGIASTGGAMSVIINNFGSEKVETKEGKTASGGKSLTIQIGEAVAGDIKSGGPVARAMKETFGIKPQLAMR